MRILEMTATFGCLDHAMLRPEPGVHVLHLPNEQGKTTWSAFLLTMLYGLETRKRGEKARYQPWNGAAMEGTVTLEHQGQTIVLQRTSERGKPMGVFRAYDRDTGMTVPWLTGENCGEKLLGVPRSVFSRSAFLQGEELAVTQDGELAARLTNLASAGESGDSFPAAEQRLKTWKNRIRYHKTGLLPEKEAALAQNAERLEAAAQLERQRLELVQECAALERQIRTLTWRTEQENRDRQRLAQDVMAQANARLESLTAQTAGLPDRETLLQLLVRLERSEEAEQPEPPCPPALQGLDEEMLLPKAQQALTEYDRLTTVPVRSAVFPAVIFAVLCLTAVGLLVCRLWLPGTVCLLAAAAAGGWWLWRIRCNRQMRTGLTEAEKLLEQYGCTVRDGVLENALRRRDWLLWQHRQHQQRWEMDVLLASFAPEAQNVEQARQAVDRALELLDLRRDAERDLERAEQLQRSALQAPPEELHRLELRCASLKAREASVREQLALLGGWEQLDAKRQALEQEIAALRQKETALILALETLQSAEQQMSRIYAPKLTALAGERLTWLTGGRYDALILKQGFELLVRERESGLTRPLASLSRGTQDQAWLSLRLAMTDLLLPQDAPLILDDALLTFDPARTAQALAALERTGRQVLVFSCRPIL